MSTSSSSASLVPPLLTGFGDGAAFGSGSASASNEDIAGVAAAAAAAAEASFLADRRLKEIEELRAERVELLQKLDTLKIQVSHISNAPSWPKHFSYIQTKPKNNVKQKVSLNLHDDRIRESALFQNVEAEMDFHRCENQALRNRLDRLTIEYEDLQSERRNFVETLEVGDLVGVAGLFVNPFYVHLRRKNLLVAKSSRESSKKLTMILLECAAPETACSTISSCVVQKMRRKSLKTKRFAWLQIRARYLGKYFIW